MTKEELAGWINGRTRRNEITKAEENIAKKDGLVVVFGYSDDGIEFRGAIYDERDCYDGGTIHVHRDGLLGRHDEECSCPFCGYEAQKKRCATIDALWDKEIGYSWTYETIIPHASFDIMSDDDKFCRGIVFNLSDLPKLSS